MYDTRPPAWDPLHASSPPNVYKVTNLRPVGLSVGGVEPAGAREQGSLLL